MILTYKYNNYRTFIVPDCRDRMKINLLITLFSSFSTCNLYFNVIYNKNLNLERIQINTFVIKLKREF